MARRSQRLRRKRRIELREAREKETKMSKTIEDNSVIIERMKNMSSALDEVCKSFDTEEIKPEQLVTPKPVVEMKADHQLK